MDRREVAPTHARTAKLLRPMMTSAVPLVASGRRRGNSFLAGFQENPEGRSSMKSLQGQWCRQRGSAFSDSPRRAAPTPVALQECMLACSVSKKSRATSVPFIAFCAAMRELVHVQGGQCASGKNGPQAKNRSLSNMAWASEFLWPQVLGFWSSFRAFCELGFRSKFRLDSSSGFDQTARNLL